MNQLKSSDEVTLVYRSQGALMGLDQLWARVEGIALEVNKKE